MAPSFLRSLYGTLPHTALDQPMLTSSFPQSGPTMRPGLTRPSCCEPPPLELSSYSHPELKLMHRLLESTQNTLFQACPTINCLYFSSSISCLIRSICIHPFGLYDRTERLYSTDHRTGRVLSVKST